ncbi:MAG: MBL fold metallo-hydrolase [Anaerolineae bacterium]|nr:MBL fold metallo-hydrolase [Anaerolineae bacterium]
MAKINLLQEGIWTCEVWLDGYDMDVRGVVILGEERAVVWDTLTHPRDMEAVVPLLKGKDIWVVYSHADWDHIWGTCGLPAAEIVSHISAGDRFQKEVHQTLRQMRVERPGVWDTVSIVCPTVLFDDYMCINLGSISLELYALPGHTIDSIVGFIPEKGVLLGGDAIEDPFPVLGRSECLKTWIDGLRYWSEHLGVRIVIPAHGAIGTRDLIERNRVYLTGLTDGSSSLPENVGEFYRQSHFSNLELAKKASG